MEILDKKRLEFYGGTLGVLLPFLVFLIGVIYIALSGAPDEKGFWPILILALGAGLILCKDKKTYSDAIIDGMSERIVMIMISAWILASIIGVLLTSTGFVEGLVWLVSLMNLGDVGYVVSVFMICCIVSLSTGSSFATILICGPLLYPAGGLLGAHLPTLAGSIIGGATFGDFTAPISDTTISSALSQEADIGQTVKSRLKYIIPAGVLASIAYFLSSYWFSAPEIIGGQSITGNPKGLIMTAVPIYIIYLFLKGRHLVHGLLYGLFLGLMISLVFGLLPLDRFLSLDLENFVAKSIIIDGINRSVGISFFTILLMGLVGVIRRSGMTEDLISFAKKRATSIVKGEIWVVGTVWAAVMMTTHSIVAILMTSDFTNNAGKRLGISPIRRANLMSLVACVFPFLMPYFIPVILMSNMTNTGIEYGVASVGPIGVGLYNFMSWALLVILFVSIAFGYGRVKDNELNFTKKSI